ncbi:MAG: hypothetical protein CVT64_05775, partial [Actinobacteria bacterium HGW-Actinobacteria-4]
MGVPASATANADEEEFWQVPPPDFGATATASSIKEVSARPWPEISPLIQEMAGEIVATGRLQSSFTTKLLSAYRDGEIIRYSKGSEVRECHIDGRFVAGLHHLIVKKNYTLGVSSTNRWCDWSDRFASSFNSPYSYHWSYGGGAGLDIGRFKPNGGTWNEANSGDYTNSSKLAQIDTLVLEFFKGSGAYDAGTTTKARWQVGQRNCRSGDPWGAAGYYSHDDSCNHVHFSLATNDRTYPKPGSGTTDCYCGSTGPNGTFKFVAYEGGSTSASPPTAIGGVSEPHLIQVESEGRVSGINWDGSGFANTGSLGRLPAGDYLDVETVGDWDGDGDPDLLVVTAEGKLSMISGTADRSFINVLRPVATDYNGVTFSQIAGPVDWDGTATPQIVARMSNGAVRVFRATADGGVEPIGNALSLSVAANEEILAPGDLNGDGKRDLVVRRADGKLYSYLVSGNKSFSSSNQAISNTGWSGVNVLLPGDIDGDGKADFLRENASGGFNLYVYKGSGTSTGFQTKTFTGLAPGAATYVPSVGTGAISVPVIDGIWNGAPDLDAGGGLTDAAGVVAVEPVRVVSVSSFGAGQTQCFPIAGEYDVP